MNSDGMEPSSSNSGSGSRPGSRSFSRELAAYLYLGDLLRGRRVLVIGAGTGEGAAHLADGGALEVVGVDASARSVATAAARFSRENLSFRVGDASALEVEDAGADAVVLPEGTDLLGEPAVLHEIRRVLRPDGVLVARVASGDRSGAAAGLSYHEVVDRLGARFGAVRMIGMAPFCGLSLVEFAEAQGDPPDLELDGSLAEGTGEIVDYVVIAGAPPEPPRGFLLVQIPPVDGLADLKQALGDVAVAGGGGDDELRRKLMRTVEERTKLEAENLTMRRRVVDAENEVGRISAQASQEIATARSTGGRNERRGGQARSGSGEARRALPDEGQGPLLVRAGDLEAALARAEAEDRLAQAKGEVAALRSKAADRAGLEADLAARARQIAKLEGELEDAKKELAAPPAMSQGGTATPALLYAAGVRHEEAMRTLAAELEERDAFVDELRAELEASKHETKLASRVIERKDADLERTERQLADARTRAARAEGELLRLRRDGGHAIPVTTPVVTPDPTTQARLAEAEGEATQVRANWRAAEAKNDELWKKIGELTKELEAIRERSVETARQQRQGAQLALTRAMDEAGKKMVSAKEEGARAEKERKALEDEVRARRNELEEVRRALEATMAAREATREDLEAYRVESTQSFLALRGEIEGARREARQDVERAELERDRALAALRIGRADGLDAETAAGLEELEELGRILAAGLREAELRLAELESGLQAAARS